MTSRCTLLVLGITLAGCTCVTPSSSVSYSCDAGSDCPDGQQCCADQRCRASCGCDPACPTGFTCSAAARCVLDCASPVSCEGNPGAPCRKGSRCPDQTLCSDGENADDGLACDGGGVCEVGHCTPCADGAACTSNPDRCHRGAVTCHSDGSTCEDSPALRPAGVACGTDRVCDATGACRDCVQGQQCPSSSPCKVSALNCSSGTARCDEVANADAGTSCDGGICDLTGACLPCVSGGQCPTNPDPCMRGRLDCSGGTVQCRNGAPKNPGGSCGFNRVCSSSGACIDCTENLRCNNNPNPCEVGLSTCASGDAGCVDSATHLPPGTPCGTNRVCNAGACVSCTAGTPCTGGNTTACHLGVVSCGTGTATCIDSVLPALPGASCPSGSTCDTFGVCGACTLGAECTSNANRCAYGVVTQCTPAVKCADGPPLAAGTPCGAPGQSCDGTGNCASCQPGLPCPLNQGSCKQGITACAGALTQCLNGPSLPEGTVCRPADAGTFGACGPGASDCAAIGLMSRLRTDYYCKDAGVCAASVTTEVSQCQLNSEGHSCGATSTGPWSACTIGDDCQSSGAQSRPLTRYACTSGSCTGFDAGDDVSPCPAEPTGCYAGQACLPGTSLSACGTGGEACATCSAPASCVGGKCR